MTDFRILSLDGGGIRGVLTLRLLERLEAAQPFLHQIDLFAGTSTGGIIALGLAAGLTPTQLLDVYTSVGPHVFRTSIWDSIRELRGIIGAPFDMSLLREKMESLVGNLKLGDLGSHILIPAFDLDCDTTHIRQSKPKFFQTFDAEDANQRIVDVALRTSAAPSYFPVYQGFIDGGVIANNPSVCAIAEAINPKRGNQQLSHMRMLSVGTGHRPLFIEAVDDDWGGWQWTKHIIHIFVEGRNDTIDYQCTQLLQNRYFRLNPTLSSPVGVADVDAIEMMLEVANQHRLTNVVDWLCSNFGADN